MPLDETIAPGQTGHIQDHDDIAIYINDHAYGVVGDISSSEPGDTAIAGTSGTVADANHQHARESWGTAGDMASSAPGDTVLPGTSGKVADANHRHAREAAPNLAQTGNTDAGDATATNVRHEPPAQRRQCRRLR